MEMHAGSDQATTETYLMPGTGVNSHITLLPPPEELDYMGNEVAPDIVYDQGLYYPAANYYGYYCTGFEPPGEWDDHHRFFGVDGQELHYPGLQPESVPYVYYTPSYGYAQSSYNPYNPYIPGAVVGVDGSFVGAQQYFASPSYQPSVSSAAFIPVVVQPGSDVVAGSSVGASLFGTGASVAGGQANAGVKYAIPLASANGPATSQRATIGISTCEPSQSSHQVPTSTKSSEGPIANLPQNKQSSSQGTMTPGSATKVPQGKISSGSMQAVDNLSHGRVSSIQNPMKMTVSSSNGIPNFGSTVRGWAPVDRFRPRIHYNGVVNNGNGSPEILGEQNRGPRTNKSKGLWTSAIADETFTTKAGDSNAQENIIIHADRYNRDDFPVDYPDAKFFVIKSYSEDDVHKSIKYNVWSSTPNGNKRLDSAYEDAQRVSAGKLRNCPIFLFFSVNASGQFCGVAEMVGPVDFHKDMDFWQQDKWTGSFPVKWHMIKDVPNTSFRHIILENNENKPVTNSRDTQEITYIPGINMLNIFKSSPLKTSILDDFMFYEERQRIMQEEKTRFLGRSYNTYLPAFVPANRNNGSPDQSPQAHEKQLNNKAHKASEAEEKPTSDLVALPTKPDEGHPRDAIEQTSKADPKAQGIQPKPTDPKLSDQPPKPGGEQPSGSTEQTSKADPKAEGTRPDHKDPKGSDQRPKPDRGQPTGAAKQSPKAEGFQSKLKVPKGSGDVGPGEDQAILKLAIKSSNDKKDSKPDPGGDGNHTNSVMKLKSLSIGSKEGEANSSGAMAVESTRTDVVTVGSMHIKVNGNGVPSSRIITVGAIPIEPKG